MRQAWAAVCVGMVLMLPSDGRGDSQESGTTQAASEEGPANAKEIDALIGDLGDRSFQKRMSATRRLCTIGTAAADRLRAAAKGGDVETRLRASAILSAFENLLFTGVEVRLAFSKTRIKWDEAVDITISFTNRSQRRARIPFEIDTGARSELTGDAGQVGDMLDLGEYLKVRDPNGETVELAVDDISTDDAVMAVVERRLDGEPIRVLEGGQEATLKVRAFNRGWARYRLLDNGIYTVVMDYVPQWEDPVLAAHRAGRVVSNEVEVTVTHGAPDVISRRGVEALLTVEHQGDSLVASLVNRNDQAAFVNRNFGRSPPFAQGSWVWELGEANREIMIDPIPAASWHEFDPALLVEVPPGRSVELARTSIPELRRTFAQLGADVDGADWTIHFAYATLCDRAWQKRQGSALLGNPKAPAIFRSPLPRQVLSTRQTSNRIEAPGPD